MLHLYESFEVCIDMKFFSLSWFDAVDAVQVYLSLSQCARSCVCTGIGMEKTRGAFEQIMISVCVCVCSVFFFSPRLVLAQVKGNLTHFHPDVR